MESAGFIEGKTYKETRFLSPPAVTYAVYLDTIERIGSDSVPLAENHSTTIELYEYAPDKQAESRIEAELDNRMYQLSAAWTKEARYWIQEEQLYQVVYHLEYITKGA